MTLSPAAVAVLAGLVAPSAEVSQDGILAGGEIWAELQGAFPLQAFWSFVPATPPVNSSPSTPPVNSSPSRTSSTVSLPSSSARPSPSQSIKASVPYTAGGLCTSHRRRS